MPCRHVAAIHNGFSVATQWLVCPAFHITLRWEIGQSVPVILGFERIHETRPTTPWYPWTEADTPITYSTWIQASARLHAEPCLDARDSICRYTVFNSPI